MRVKTVQVKCEAINVCEVLSCHWCWAIIANPQCADKWLLITAGFALNLIAFLIINVFKAFGHIIHFIKFAANCFCLGAGCCQWLARLRPTNRKSDETSLRRRYRKWKPETKPLLLCVLLFGIVSKSAAASLDTTRILQANEEECLVQASGRVSCTYNNVTVYKMRPTGPQTLQMILQDHARRSVGTLTLELAKPQAICRKRTLSFTRNFEGQAFSEKRCNTRGSCSSELCETLRPQQRIPELSLPQQFPGYSYCAQTPGGIQEGCFPFTTACIFYRVFARPINLTVYELFDCTQWDLQIDITLKKTTADESQDDKIVLSPGLTHTWMSSVKLTAMVNEPLTALVTDKFLTDGTRTAMISDYQERSINLRCPTRRAATDFACVFPPEKCRCTVAGSGVNCDCEAGNTPTTLLREPNLLPRQQGKTWIMPGPIADVPIPSLELTVSVNDLTAEGIVDASHCHFHAKPMYGCYRCESGAVFNFSCATDFGSAIATVDCDGVIFSARCDPNWIEQEIVLTLNDPINRLECMAHCPASSSAIIIEGSLVPGQLSILNTYDHALNTPANSTYGSILEPLQNGLAWIWGTVKLAGSLLPNFFQYYPFLLLGMLPVLVYCIFPFFSIFYPIRIIFRLLRLRS